MLICVICELSHVERFFKISSSLIGNVKSVVRTRFNLGIPLSILASVANIGSTDIPRELLLHIKWSFIEKFMRLVISSYHLLEPTISNARSTEELGIPWFLRYINPHVYKSEDRFSKDVYAASIFDLFCQLGYIRITQIDKWNWHFAEVMANRLVWWVTSCIYLRTD